MFVKGLEPAVGEDFGIWRTSGSRDDSEEDRIHHLLSGRTTILSHLIAEMNHFVRH